MRLGKNMKHALEFIKGCQGWISFKNERSTVNAIKALHKLGLVEINSFNQFRYNGGYDNDQ